MILLFGPQGSGKGTQAGMLAASRHWRWLSMGHLLRDSADPEIHRRQEIGELIDDELTNKVLSAALAAIDIQTEIILEGYPRNANQAQWLMNNILNHGRSLDCVLEVHVPKEESLKRMLARGRADDTVSAIQRRLEIYHSETEPIIDFYRSHNVPYFQVDGIGSVDDVQSRILDAVKACGLK